MTHTPGPWTVYKNEPLDGSRHVALGSKYERAIVAGKSATANARLIAAAPDLLAACEAAIDGIEEWNDFAETDKIEEAVALLVAAIAKAKGEA